jgi:hypothetical protein
VPVGCLVAVGVSFAGGAPLFPEEEDYEWK